ncbi:MAG TPA: DUF2844 domain-containing protein [Terriglobales bacterium]|nr:DUF2844 domain-containing protein [Terriglobales bacterium]
MKLFFRRSISFTAFMTLGIVWAGLSSPALAALGGDVASVAADQAHMKANVEVKQAGGYEVHALRAPGGTVVSEYVSPSGRVFAVAWHGPFFPEMQQILGSYFQQYSAALQERKPYGHRPLNLEQPGLVVQSGGHMRAYYGRAYIPEMLPQGLKVEEIK